MEKIESNPIKSPSISRVISREEVLFERTNLPNAMNDDFRNPHCNYYLPKKTIEYTSENPKEIWFRTLPQILGQMHNSPETKKILLLLIKLSKENDSDIWSQYFSEILLSVLESFKHEDPTVREMAVLLLKEIMKNQNPSLFPAFTDTIAFGILEVMVDSTREVLAASKETMDQFVLISDPLKTIEALIPLISIENKAIIPTIQLLSQLIISANPSNLLKQLPQILPGLLDIIKNPNADIRKVVVFCLADLYLLLGNEFTPYLSQLSVTQAKLVQIYSKRRMDNVRASHMQI